MIIVEGGIIMEKIIYIKSLSAKLVLNPSTIDVYQQLKDLCATHKDVKTRLSFYKETINYGKNKVAMMKVSRKNITLYLNLNPKRYVHEQYNMKDISDTKIGEIYPTTILINNKKNLKHALKLLETALAKVKAKELCQAEWIDYKEQFYPRDFDTLVAEGLIKKYIRTKVDGQNVLMELCDVHFTAKLLYEAENQANNLYIITNYSNWDVKKAVLMKQVANNVFTATISFPKNTPLEFKICRTKNWSDVEKGIWKEEIVNHQYVLVDKNLEVEDLIHNFRNE